MTELESTILDAAFVGQVIDTLLWPAIHGPSRPPGEAHRVLL